MGSQILENALNEGNIVFAYSGELPDYFFKRWIDFQIAGKHNVILVDCTGESGTVSYFIPKEKQQQRLPEVVPWTGVSFRQSVVRG